MPEHCTLVDRTPAESSGRELTAENLTRIAGILVEQLQQAGVKLASEPTLDETKRLLVEMIRAARAAKHEAAL